MVYNRRVFLSACLTLLSINIFAEYDQEDEEWQEELSSDEIIYDDELVDASMYPVIAQECNQPLQTAPKLHHYVLYGDMLYLKPYMGSMPWTFVQDKSGYYSPFLDSTATESISERISNINIDFDFGFRLGLGFNTTWLKLENQLTWMRLHTQTSQSLSTLTNVNGISPSLNYQQPKAYVPYWFYITSSLPPGQEISATEKTRLEWDQIDWVFKIPLSPYKRLTYLPLLGIRGLISEVKSDQTQYFSAYGETFSTTMPLNNTVTKLKEKFNAVGLVAGIDGDIYFGYGLHLSALFDASLVYGDMRRNASTFINVPLIAGTLAPQEFEASDKNYKVKPIFDAQATLSWNWNFCKDKLTLNTHIGYEIHYMPRFLEFIRMISDGDSPYYYDLMLQGLNAGLGLSF